MGPKAMDLSSLVDETSVRVLEETQVLQLHDIFRKLGAKVILVERGAELAGIITKKGFVHHLHLMEMGEHICEEDEPDGAWEADAGGDITPHSRGSPWYGDSSGSLGSPSRREQG